MYSRDDLDRVKLILVKIDYILEISTIGIVKALDDEKMTRPAIMMHLTSIAEQFSKIKDQELLKKFDDEDVKGAINTRNFIAHDYEGVNLPIIEFIIRDRLPVLKHEIIIILQ
ncbi:MAG: DUF86 domain-containing protein [Sulfurimonas sp.]|nr:DUF86 domain-containing protein [Sulfurimonas sp.]MBL1245019.1 DUF86 domain-containing protein [Sulfurimonas sp.]